MGFVEFCKSNDLVINAKNLANEKSLRNSSLISKMQKRNERGGREAERDFHERKKRKTGKKKITWMGLMDDQ